MEGAVIAYLNLFALLILFTTVLLFLFFCVRLFIFFIKKKPFPKKLLIAVLAGTIAVCLKAGYNKYFFTFDMDDSEFYKGPLISPTETYIANAYYQTYGGAAGGVNLWVEITYNNETGQKKTIYYSDAKSNFAMEWMDEDTLFIINAEPGYPSENNSIKLDVAEEIYHDSGLA
ncbi:DUF5412 family protein [Virgibacillus indicus]|uniref:DUF5412 family protein n=1 Tax=Virgibacillus indicus TaxID=2024554 RepID=UPI001F0ABC41|nr:DUF5412 family protein [Virgibacillus indicus]